MNATRRTQPYRAGSDVRNPGPALSAMLGGQPFFLPNPMDQRRRVMRGGSLADLLAEATARVRPPGV